MLHYDGLSYNNAIHMKDKSIPIISVIIPVFNNERFVRSAVGSVLFQEVDNNHEIELIIVDDGSTDNTPDIVDEISLSDDRVTVIHQENQWIYASMNNGISASSGDYIYILNSDDILLGGAIQKMIECVERNNRPDVVWTKVLWRDVDMNQNMLSEHDINPTVTKDEYIGTYDGVRENWLFVQESNLAVNQANLYKRELALLYPFRNDVYAADSFFNLGIVNCINSMAIMKDPVYVYMSYNNPSMNASVGKYYGYEHKMFNDLMKEEIRIYSEWGRIDKYLDSVVLKRLREMSYEISILGFRNCSLSFSEKLEKVFGEIADHYIREYSRMVGREREYESRILNGVKCFVEKSGQYEHKPDYVTTLMSFLPDDYKSNVDWKLLDKKAVNHAVNDVKNKDNIGRVYYSEDW